MAMLKCCSLSTGTAVRLHGGWQLSPPGKEQSVEVDVEVVQILGENDAAVCSRPWSRLSVSSLMATDQSASKEISDTTVSTDDSPSSISIASECSPTSAAIRGDSGHNFTFCYRRLCAGSHSGHHFF